MLKEKRKCRICGLTIVTAGKRLGNCCSLACRNKEKGIISKCTLCNKDYYATSMSQKYCSAECGKKVMKRSSSEYYTKVKEYGTFRIFERDNFQCVYCGASAHNGSILHVDHIYPKDKGGGNDLVNLITACSECNLQKKDMLLTKDKILSLWERNKKANMEKGLDNSYKELLEFFNKKYKINESI